MPLTSGSRVGPYEVISSLGAGGMGEVYRARDTKLGRDVALKILPDAFAGDPERLARFEREAKTLASLNHPHVAHVYGFEQSHSTDPEHTGFSALVMELVEGEDLSQRLASGAIPMDEALPIARQIAEALEAAHEQGIVHRDLKPANIKVRPDGTVKVLDFGLAKALEGSGGVGNAWDGAGHLLNSPTITSPAMTERGMILGTAAYMSPEQAKGKPVDRRADIWAFGAVLYEMLTGHRAFPGEDVTDTIAFVITREPDWTALPRSTPPAVRTLLRRCLEKDRKRRLADAGDARLEIDDAMSAPAVSVDVPPMSSAPRTRSSAVAAAAVSAVVFGLAGALAGRQFAPPPATAPLTRFTITAPPAQQFRAVGRTVCLSPDGSQMVLAFNQGLFIRSMGSLEPRPIAGVDPGAINPIFSLDGQSIAYWSVRDQMIKSIAVSGGAPVTHGSALRDAAGLYSGMSWDRTGIVVAQGSSGVVRFPSSGGPAETIATVRAGEYAASPMLLPGGEHVLFTVVSGTGTARWAAGQIVVQSLKTQARKLIVARGSDAQYLATGHLVFAVEGVLFAAPFDVSRLELMAAAVPMIEGVRRANVSNAMSQFSIADNGTLAYVPGPVSASSTFLDLAVINRKGESAGLRMPPGAYEAPRISPDGKQVAFHSDDGKEAVVWIHELAGSTSPRRLTFSGRNRFPVWSSDGQSVVFQSDREGDLGLFEQRADGSGAAERLTKAEDGAAHVAESWSPRSGHLLLTITRSSEVALMVMSTSDKRIEPFGAVRSLTFTNATFSPDGRWVAYGTTEKDRPVSAVFVQPFPATGAVYQVSRDDDGHHPVWSRDGKEIIYVPGPGRLSIVQVTTSPAFAVTEAIAYPPAGIQGPPTVIRNFDILDATRFVGLVPGGSEGAAATAPIIHVVLNWFDELTSRVPITK